MQPREKNYLIETIWNTIQIALPQLIIVLEKTIETIDNENSI